MSDVTQQTNEAVVSSAPADTQQQVEQVAQTTQPIQQPQSFIDLLPDDLKQDPSLQSFKDVTSLAKSYVESRKLIGASVRIPTQDATPEVHQEFFNKLSQIPGVAKLPSEDNQKEVDEFYNKLGRPEKPEEYQVKFADGVEVDAETYNKFTAIAHKNGLTNKQLQALAEFESERSLALTSLYEQSYEQAAKSCEAHLKSKWGSDYDNRMAGAKEAKKMYEEKYGKEMVDHMVANSGNNPIMLEILSDIYATSKEKGGASTLSTSNIQYGESAEAAKYRLNEIYRGRDKISKDYLNGVQYAKDEVSRLNSIITD